MKTSYLFAVFFVLYELTVYMANDMIMPGMTQVINEFHAADSYIALSLTLYIFGNTLLQLFLGPMSEKYGRRHVLLFGNICFSIFTVLIIFSDNINHFMINRLIQGAGLAFIAVGYALIHEKFNDQQAVRITAIMGNVTLLAPLLGPLFGVIIIAHMNWRYVFVFTLLASLVSLYGLYRYTPYVSPQYIKFNPFKTYLEIVLDKNFLLGAIANGIAPLPIICWIAISPAIIILVLKLGMAHYAIYQIIAIGGITIATLSMQYLAGKISFYKLTCIGNGIALLGLLLGTLWIKATYMLPIAMFIHNIGLGIFSGLVTRTLMTNKQFPNNMIMSTLVFIQTVCLVVGLYVVNCICDRFHFSVASFTYSITAIEILCFILVLTYSITIKSRSWN